MSTSAQRLKCLPLVILSSEQAHLNCSGSVNPFRAFEDSNFSRIFWNGFVKMFIFKTASLRLEFQAWSYCHSRSISLCEDCVVFQPRDGRCHTLHKGWFAIACFVNVAIDSQLMLLFRSQAQGFGTSQRINMREVRGVCQPRHTHFHGLGIFDVRKLRVVACGGLHPILQHLLEQVRKSFFQSSNF